MDIERVNSVLQYILLDLLDGPRTFQFRQVINLQKGSTLLVMVWLMVHYGNYSTTAYVYTSLHGSYGLIWLLKDRTMRDPAWNAYQSIYSSVLVGCTLMMYWSPGYLIITRNITASNFRLCMAIMMHTFGVVLMMCADAQKYYTLRLKKGLISDGFVHYCRNTNYLGEIMLYAAYAVVAQHWFPWIMFSSVWSSLFLTNMLIKDKSLRKKDGAKVYFERSGLLLPNLQAWWQSI